TSAELGTDGHIWPEKIKEHEQAFQAAMDDDYNTANAITVLFDIAKDANVYLEQNQTNTAVVDADATEMEVLLDVLGIQLVEEELLDDEIDALIEERNEARKAKNFARADEIRDLLKDKGIILEDTAQGVRWRRA